MVFVFPSIDWWCPFFSDPGGHQVSNAHGMLELVSLCLVIPSVRYTADSWESL